MAAGGGVGVHPLRPFSFFLAACLSLLAAAGYYSVVRDAIN
jgi:hypothetical protein